jgi:oligoribonuclease
MITKQGRREIRHNWLWLDLETTGLDPRDGRIVEYAALLVDDGPDGDMSITRGCEGILHFKQMGDTPVDDYVQRMHAENGLWEECAESDLTVQEAEDDIIAMLGIHQRVMLAGSSVHFDLGWIRVRMPRLAARLHYRVLDVSTLATAAGVWGNYTPPPARSAHRALPDLRDTLAQAARLRALLAGGRS